MQRNRFAVGIAIPMVFGKNGHGKNVKEEKHIHTKAVKTSTLIMSKKIPQEIKKAISQKYDMICAYE